MDSKIRTIAEQDALLKDLWREFSDVPMDPDTEKMEEEFLDFPAGTPRQDIWKWFDERYSKGVYNLLYGAGGVDRTDKIAKLTYLNGLSFECETKDCVYNHDDECRYALVHEKEPDITEGEGCVSGEIPCII